MTEQTGLASAESPAELRGDAIDEHIIGGLKWVSAASIFVEGASAATTVVIARLVSPAQYGLAVIALIVPVLASILTYEGFGTPLVLRRQVDRADVETATFVSLGVGVLLSALVMVFALFVAAPVFGRQSEVLFGITSPAFLIFSAGAVPRAMLSRRLRWKLMNASDVGGALVAAAVSTVLAILGWGSSAVVIGAMAGGLATTVLLGLCVHPARPRWDRKRVAANLRVGTSAAGAGIAMTFRRNIDYVMLATRLSPHLVGIYWRGFSLGVEQQSKISGITTRVAVSVLPRTGGANDLRSARRRLVRMNTLVIFPLLGVLVATAPWFVPSVYGDKWAAAVVPTQVLSIGGMVWATLAGMEGALLAAGAPGALALFNFVSLVTVAFVAYVMAPLGVVAVAVAMVGLELTTLVAAQYFLLFKRVDVPPRDAAGDSLPAAMCTGVMVVVAAPVASAVSGLVGPLLVVAVAGAFALVIYGALIRTLFPTSWELLLGLLRAVGATRLVLKLRRSGANRMPPSPALHEHF